MTFEDDTGIDSIDLSDGDVVNVRDESIKKEIEVFPTDWPSKVVVVWSHSIKVSHIWLQTLQQVQGIFLRDSWNGGSSLAEFEDVGEVHGEALEVF